MRFKVLLPDQLGLVYQKALKTLPDVYKAPEAFFALYALRDSLFLEVGDFDGAVWLLNIIPGWKASIHIVLWEPISAIRKNAKKALVLGQYNTAKIVIRELFYFLRLQRLDCYIPVRAKGACRYAENVGFTMEGIMHKAGCYNSTYVDIATYAIFKEDL